MLEKLIDKIFLTKRSKQKIINETISRSPVHIVANDGRNITFFARKVVSDREIISKDLIETVLQRSLFEEMSSQLKEEIEYDNSYDEHGNMSYEARITIMVKEKD